MDNHKFLWTDEEIEQAALLFSQGHKPSEVADLMDEKVVDVGLLFIDLVETGKVKKIKKKK